MSNNLWVSCFVFYKTQNDQQQYIPGRIKVSDTSRIKLSNNLGFAIDIKPDQLAGNILNLSNGLTLALGTDGLLQLSLQSSDGNRYQTTASKALTTGQWHKVAGQFQNGQLTLTVNDISTRTAVPGDVTYTPVTLSGQDASGNPVTNNYDLTMGDNFDGQLNALKWYNLATEPLVTFANGQETTRVTIDGTQKAQVELISTGKMRSFASQLSMQNVAVQTSDDTQNITLLSNKLFELMAGKAINAGIVDNAPVFDQNYLNDLTGLDNQQPPSALWMATQQNLFPNAHAYDLSFWDIAGIVASLVGLDSLQVIWDQVGNMLAGRDVDIVSMTLAILDVLTLFLPAAPLKLVIAPVKLAVKLLRVGNNQAVRYLGGVMKRVYQNAKNRNFTLVYQGAAFLLWWPIWCRMKKPGKGWLNWRR